MGLCRTGSAAKHTPALRRGLGGRRVCGGRRNVDCERQLDVGIKKIVQADSLGLTDDRPGQLTLVERHVLDQRSVVPDVDEVRRVEEVAERAEAWIVARFEVRPVAAGAVRLLRQPVRPVGEAV